MRNEESKRPRIALGPPGNCLEAIAANEISNVQALRVLVVGAGGLGCEILAGLAQVGFRQLDVIDMDTIELSNLNRQFLFRSSDIGRPKAEAAAAFVMRQVPNCHVSHHISTIQDKSDDFYRQFHIVVCGLDSISARRWINAKLVELSAEPGPQSLRPLIDGGSEGLMGQVRVILPSISACYECTLDLVPPAHTSYPLCTIAATPRIPEHCIEWARAVAWPHEFPGTIPTDNDLEWLFEKALSRATHFGISGVTLSLTQGVLKRIVPAISSTNAVISSACCIEALKIATGISDPVNNYFMYSGKEGIFTHTFELARRDDCPVCGSCIAPLKCSPSKSLSDCVELLKRRHLLDSPSITTSTRSLIMQHPESLRKATVTNLPKPLSDLVNNGDEIAVTDDSLPFPVRVKIIFV